MQDYAPYRNTYKTVHPHTGVYLRLLMEAYHGLEMKDAGTC